MGDAGKELRYFDWLVRRFIGEESATNYYLLLHRLFVRDFYWVIDKDENRAKDGDNLRKQYMYEESEDYPMYRLCSILEMLVALSSRIDSDIMYDFEMGERGSFWFWTMLRNLGIDEFDDKHFDQDSLDEILDVFLDRKHLMDGKGGLFPIKHPKKDQRKVEIWFQMQQFLLENYEI